MNRSWTSYKLTDLGTIARGKSKHRPRDASHLYGGRYPFVQTGDIKASNHRLNKHTQTYSEAGLAQSKLWPKDTMCITIAANIAETAILEYPACFPDSIIGFIANKEICDIDFVEYLLQYFRKQIQTHSIGSVQDNINLETFQRIEFKVPFLPEQRAIASILSALDDKIELNLQMNKTLEEMVMALYKHWFVDFGPFRDGEFVTSELGEIPKGWEVKRIGEIASIIDCLHSKKPELLLEDNGNIFLQLDNILDNGLLDLSKKCFISNKDYQKWTSRIEVGYGDCLITNVGRSGAVARIPKNVKAAIGRNMTAIRLNKEYFYPGFLVTMLTSKSMKTTIKKYLDDGTILQALNVKNIPLLHFFSPLDKTILDSLEKEFELKRSLMENNIHENQTLTTLRNTLLPKLISGEVRVKDASKMVEEVL